MKKANPDPQKELNQIQGEDALDQSMALNRVVMSLLDQSKKQNRWLAILLAISLSINILIVCAFLWYEKGFDTSSVTTTTTITQDTGEGNGNNVYQSGDSARYYQDGDAHG